MRHYGLIGSSLSHSFSPAYFKEKFAHEGISARYDAFELAGIEALPELLGAHPNLQGFNVTIPYKEAVLLFLDQCSTEAKEIGAVNCIAVGQDKRLTGHNTDWLGFSNTLKPLLHSYSGPALILGSGGAAKAVRYALDRLGIAWQTVSRQGPLSYPDVDAAVLESVSMLINTTPLGMYPDPASKPPLPYHLLCKRHLLYDLVYNPSETAFLRAGKEQGAAGINGLPMLIEQAELSWQIWNGEG